MTVAISPFDPADGQGAVDLILSIQRGEYGMAITAGDQPDLRAIPSFYQVGLGDFLVAKAGGQVVGTVALKDIGDGQAALRKMFVAPAFRGAPHRTAQALLDRLIERASGRGVEQLFLGTTAHFLAAHRFYEKNSFGLVEADALPPAFPRMAVDTRFYHRIVR